MVKTQFRRSDYESKGTSDSVEGVAFGHSPVDMNKEQIPVEGYKRNDEALTITHSTD